MKILSCLFCDGELEILNIQDHSSFKKVKCIACNFVSPNKVEKQDDQLEVFIRRPRRLFTTD